MAVTYTTSRLLADIKRLGHFPANQQTFQDADLLAMLDYELQTYIVPMMMKVREGFFTRIKEYPIDSAVAAYKFPERAIGSRLGDVQLVIGNYIEQLRLINVGQLDSNVGSPVGARAFTVQGNNIVLIPIPTYGILRVYYHTRPSKLVKPIDCAQIISIDRSLNQVTVGSTPSTFNLSALYDLVGQNPGFDTSGEDRAITNLTANVITFSSALPTDLQVGDYVCLSGQSPIAQIPVELMPLLTQACVVKVYEIQGYMDKLKAAKDKLAQMQTDLMALITPRVEEAPKIINAAQNDVTVSTRFGFNRFRRY